MSALTRDTAEDHSDAKLRDGLESGESHVWLVHEQSIDSPAVLSRYRELLDGEERARCERFVFPADQHRALVTRALVRTILSRYEDCRPEAWRFRSNAYGRPEIESPSADGLRFNLSHTRGLVACIVSLNREVGVDVENRLRGGRLIDVAHRFFAPFEVQSLEATAPERQLARFFTYWTLKESYIKARGMGLAIPLADFWFCLDEAAENIRIELNPRLGDSPERWSFEFEHLSIAHSLATAVEKRTPDERPRVVVRTIVP